MNPLRAMLVVTMTLALPAFAQPVESTCPGIVAKVVKVDGRNDEWTPSGVKIKAGDLVLTAAEGAVKVGAWTGEVDANGAPDGTGRLEVKIGTGTVLPVGKRWFEEFQQDAGALKLRVQDRDRRDNAGQYGVGVIVIPGCAIPAPEIVEAE